jgi:hypothetical protein
MSVYIGARDLSGVPLGTHQFIVLHFSEPQFPIHISGMVYHTKYLGDGHYGVVIGAQNRGSLVVEIAEKGDLLATREYFGAANTSIFKPDFSSQLRLVDYGTVPDAEAKRRVMQLATNFRLNQAISPIPYPFMGLGYNSNSFVQSLIRHSGGNVDTNMNGWDVSHDKVIPKTYFEAQCPVKPRPTLN